MKKFLLLAFHPDLTNWSKVNKAMYKKIETSGEFDCIDVYKLYPDLKIDIPSEQKRLEKYDSIIFQFPMFWYSGPALLKQYIDFVWKSGWNWGPNGRAFLGKKIYILTSATLSAEDFTADGSQNLTVKECYSSIVASFENVTGAYIQDVLCYYGALVLDVDKASKIAMKMIESVNKHANIETKKTKEVFKKWKNIADFLDKNKIDPGH